MRLTLLGSWVLLLVLVPTYQVGHEYWTHRQALERSHLLYTEYPQRTAIQGLLIELLTKPDYRWKVRDIGQALSRGQPVSDQFSVQDFMNGAAMALNLLFRVGLIVIAIGLMQGQAWTPFAYAASCFSFPLSHFFPASFP